MNIKKTIMAVAFIGATGLFATTLAGISTLVEQVNNTKNVEVKEKLMSTLSKSMNALNEEDRKKAQAMIEKDLKPIK